MRVVIDGAENSPLELGTLQLDRTAPTVSWIALTPAGGAIAAEWTQWDDLSGTDPAGAVIAEVNASPAGDAAGAWVAFAQQPAPGDGHKVARTRLDGLMDGRHLVRARARDRAGNTGVSALGAVLSDGTPPAVTDVALARALSSPTALAEITFRASDGAGVGLSGEMVRVGPAGSGDDLDWAMPGASGPGHVLVRLPGPGVHVVTVRVLDRLGNRGESAPLTIRVPTPAEAADAAVSAPPGIDARAGAAPGRRVTWAYAQVRRFLRQRGVPLTARLRVARNAGQWRRLLGISDASRYTGYSTLRGRILLGPAVTRGLEAVAGARVGGARVRARALGASRADLDEAVLGLAVLLHESLHESGPVARGDILGTRSGRAFEEGFTEAATDDLLSGFVARLDLPPGLRARLGEAVARYRPAYGAEVAWARRMSVRATHAPAGSARAQAWRVRVADRWGSGRWTRLAAATGRDEATLRADAAARGGSGPRR